MASIGRDDLAQDPDLAQNAGRVKRVEEIDGAIAAWTQSRPIQEVLETLNTAKVPAGRVYTVKDIFEDPHYRARDMILKQRTRDGDEVHVPGIVPKMSLTPGQLRTPAPHLGEDTQQVLLEMGLTGDQIAELRSKGIVA